MLRCPRCADPLVAVTPSSSTCPAGSRCPHESRNKSIYAGGGIVQQPQPVIPNLNGHPFGPMSSCNSHNHHCCCSNTCHQPQPHLFQEISRPSMSLALMTTASFSPSQVSTPAFVIAGTANPFDFGASHPAWLSTFPQFSPTPDISFPVSNTQEVLKTNLSHLKQCGWFYGDVSWQESAKLLEGASLGTFLVRNSSDQRFLFSLSVQRTQVVGPTSVRIHFSNGKFRLDAEEKIRDLMPEFSTVAELIAYYLSLSSTTKKNQVWVDNIGKQSPICLKQPLYTGEAPSLAHFARLAINRSISHRSDVSKLGLPPKLSQFLEQYPHTI